MAKDKSKNKAADPLFGQLPMRVEISWIEQADTRRDAVDMARGHIDQRFVAKDASWYRVMPFLGGYFYETQEGGPGKSYLDAIVDELKRNPGGEYWLPNGPTKVVRIVQQDGKPKALVPNEQESLAIRNSGRAPLIPRGSMKPFARRGTGTMIFGGVFCGASLIYMLGTMGFYLSVWQPGPSVRDVKLADLPTTQWSMVEFTGPKTIVSKLLFSNGKWDKVERPHIIPGLEVEIQEGRRINAEFGRQEFDFEKKDAGSSIGGNVTPSTAPETQASPTAGTPSAEAPKPDAGNKPAAQIAPPSSETNKAAPTPDAAGGTPPATAPDVVNAPAAQAQPTPANADQERSKRVMEQIKRMREMNAQKAKQEDQTKQEPTP